MRISELSAVSDVPVATIKYYLREGLLPAGERTARNQADYGPVHLTRLRLIRALIDVGSLRIDDTRALLAALDDPALSPGNAVRAAHSAVTNRARPSSPGPQWARARAAVLAVTDQRGWRLERDTPAIDQAADAVAAVLEMDVPNLRPLLDLYAGLAESIAGHELAAALSAGEAQDVVRGIVVGTVIGEALLNALRLLALQSVSKTLLEPVEPDAAG